MAHVAQAHIWSTLNYSKCEPNPCVRLSDCPLSPWQAALSLFNDRISSAVHSGIAGALSGDVPSAVNGVLASLPTHVVVQVGRVLDWGGVECR